MEYIDISDPSIMGGRFQQEVEKQIVEICGLNFHEYLRYKKVTGENLLVNETLESNYSKIIERFEELYGIDKYSLKVRIAYQVFGYLLLKTNSHIPTWLKSSIIEASKWRHEKHYWSEKIKKNERIENLREFRNNIRSYQQREIDIISEKSSIGEIKEIIHRAFETSNPQILQKNLIHTNFKQIFIQDMNEILDKREKRKIQLGIFLIQLFFIETPEPDLKILIRDSKSDFLAIIEKCTLNSRSNPFWDDYLAKYVGDIFSNLIRKKIEKAVRINDYNSLSFILFHNQLELLNDDDLSLLFTNKELNFIEYLVENLYNLDKDDSLSMFGLHLSNRIEEIISQDIESSTIRILKKTNKNQTLIEPLISLNLISYLTEENVINLLESEDLDILNILLEHRYGDFTESNISIFFKKHKIDDDFIKTEIIKEIQNNNIEKIYRFLVSRSFNLFSKEEVKSLFEDQQLNISKKIVLALNKFNESKLLDWTDYFWFDEKTNNFIFDKLKNTII